MLNPIYILTEHTCCLLPHFYP